jgi:hypothetical protein
MNKRRLVSNLVGFAFLFGTISLLGCSDLPELAMDTCGNFVIDDKEDCDSFSNYADGTCAGVGEVHACLYVCPAPNYRCPAGSGCGSDGVCRWASGKFSKEYETEGYVWPRVIEVGDFDSNGSGDLLLLGAADSAGYRPARTLFSDGFSLQSGFDALPTELANPAVGAGAESDVLHDIAFADFDGIALFRGYSDRTADFTVFPTLSLPRGADGRIVMTDALPSRPGDEIVAFVTGFGGMSALMGFQIDKPPTKLVSMSGGVGSLTLRRGYSAARFDETRACSQIIFAFEGADTVELYSPCTAAGTWSVNGVKTLVKLQPSAPIDKGVMTIDINADGRLDLIIGAGGRTYVAYGTGDGHFLSQKPNGSIDVAGPYDLPFAAGGPWGFPLAIADLNLDGQVDFVTPHRIVVSEGTGYYAAYVNLGAPWTEALVANFNGNDLPDVVTIVDDALDVHFLNNAGNGVFGMATLPTEGIPSKLTVGDFDGDLLADVVFSEAIAEHGEISDHLSFAFGNAFGPLDAPRATGEVGRLGQIVVGHLRNQAGPDPMTEVGVLLEGNGGLADNIATLSGRASRAIFSMVPLRMGTDLYIPISLAFGKFGDDTSDIAALGVNRNDGLLRLFRIEAFDEEGLGIPLGSEPLLPNFIPSNNSGIYNLRHGAKVVAADFDGDKTDEALVVGSYADLHQGAFALAKYDTMEAAFRVIDAKVFSGKVTIDSRILVDDLDGNGTKDIVLTTGTSTAPGDLIIAWGNGSAKLPQPMQDFEYIRLNGLGVRAVASVRSRHGGGKTLVVSNFEKTYLLEFTAKRTWTEVEIANIGSAGALGIADFDRDGVEDLAVQLEDGLELFRSIPK